MSGVDPAREVEGLLGTLKEALGLECEIEVRTEDDVVHGVLVGEDLGLFIGHHGQTIEAVQHLAQRAALKGGGSERPSTRIVIDAAGYRDRRASGLRREADEAAARAIESGGPVALDAMVASERRLVHEHLRDRGDVETYSEGDEPNRHLVVAPASAG